jgi:hypothetical protein
VLIADTPISRPAVTTTITNGSFGVDLSSWTDADEGGAATSVWVAGGYMGLTGDNANYAIRRQQVTITAANSGIEHALEINIKRGPVVLRVGSASGSDDYITETMLGTGYHSLAFTPTTGSAWVEFKSVLLRQVLVDSVAFAAAGDMVLTAPYAEADLKKIRYEESADVIYLACDGYQPRKIERRATRSWSLVKYEPEDGPFRVENTTPTTISAGSTTGNGQRCSFPIDACSEREQRRRALSHHLRRADRRGVDQRSEHLHECHSGGRRQ